MVPEERSEIREILESSRQDFNDAVAGLAEERAKISPGPGRWSVLDCAEHVAIVEERFLGWLERAKRLDQPRADPAREQDLQTRVTDRSIRAQAPEAVQPAGRFATLEQALAYFNAARSRTIQFTEDKRAELYVLAAEHPRFGPVNGPELVQIIAGHARRHAAQIREIRAAIGELLH